MAWLCLVQFGQENFWKDGLGKIAARGLDFAFFVLPVFCPPKFSWEANLPPRFARKIFPGINF
jgi:hypothetical protein